MFFYDSYQEKADRSFKLFFYFNQDNALVGVNFEKNLQNFPEAVFKSYPQFMKKFKDYYQGKTERLNHTIIMEGTLFQKAVWNYILNIPRGAVVSYKEIADAIGHPRACRAVGSAVNKNPFSIILPCHRVLNHPKNKVGKFAGSEGIKKYLLKKEGVLL